MSQEDNLDDLNTFVPRPDATGAKRHMVACDADSYAFITETAKKLDTTRNRVVTALVSFYRDGE